MMVLNDVLKPLNNVCVVQLELGQIDSRRVQHSRNRGLNVDHNQLLETLNWVDNCSERIREVVTEANNSRILQHWDDVFQFDAGGRSLSQADVGHRACGHTNGELCIDTAFDMAARGSFDPYCRLCVGCRADLKVIREGDDIAEGIYNFYSCNHGWCEIPDICNRSPSFLYLLIFSNPAEGHGAPRGTLLVKCC
ncbi:uncharacterized [Tachysurus ichikawai]